MQSHDQRQIQYKEEREREGKKRKSGDGVVLKKKEWWRCVCLILWCDANYTQRQKHAYR